MKHPSQLRLAMAQINVVVGDIEGNARKILEWIDRARDADADIVTFPELALTGYPPEDLLLKPQFIDANLAALEKVVSTNARYHGDHRLRRSQGRHFQCRRHCTERKAGHDLPQDLSARTTASSMSFDISRPGSRCPVLQMDNATIGVSICEDIWYPDGPVFQQALSGGAEVIINISSSPYHAGKRRWRERMLATRAADNTVIVAYNNLVGGQDELVFDGDSLVFDENGDLIARGKQFEEDLIVVDLDVESVFRKRLHDPRRRQQKLNAGQTAEVFSLTSQQATASLRRRRLRRLNRLPKMPRSIRRLSSARAITSRRTVSRKSCLGLSGGIDSALTACVAVDALGSENVVGVLMPSEFSSRGSIEDSEQLGKNLGIELLTIPISDVLAVLSRQRSKPGFKGAKPDVTEENLQARIRGNYLMALSNKFGWLVLSTGNKSEVSTGYCTLYGDMAGGFALLKDVMKTTVYRLARIAIGAGRTHPARHHRETAVGGVASKSAGYGYACRPMTCLIRFLKAYVEEDRSFAEMVEMGFDEQLVRRVIRMVDTNEYKRRQAAPGVKITPRAFGRDRRMPITNRFR